MDPRPVSAFVHDVRVTWGDCDPAKIAYTARLPWFALDAIDAWWSEFHGPGGWFHLEVDTNVGTPFVRMEMDFMSPVTPRHILKCHVWPAKLGTKSITFRVDGVQDGVTCFQGAFTCVFIIADQFKSQAAPEHLRALIEPHIPVRDV